MKISSSTDPDFPINRGNLRVARMARLIYEAALERVYGGMVGQGFPEVRPAHSAIFRNIDPAGSRASDLAQRAGITKQSVAYLIEGLEKDGLLETLPDPEDGRARLVRLTPRGQAALETLNRLSEAMDSELAAALPEGRMEMLRQDLATLVEHLRG